MHLNRRRVLQTLGTAAALGLAGPRLAGAWRSSSGSADGLQRLDGFRGRAGAGTATATVTEPVRAARAFSLVGVTAPPGSQVEVRASADGEEYGEWLPLPAQADENEGPEGVEADTAGDGWRRSSAPVWTGTATWLQLRVQGADPAAVEAALVDGEPHVADAALAGRMFSGGAPRVRQATWGGLDEPDTIVPVGSGLDIIRRADWGAVESLRRSGPSYAEGGVRHGVVHHTATPNDYRESDGPRIVRGIYEYHVNHNRWNDIGYNLLIDRYGRVYEGRYGGLDRAVIGAHAAGANTGSFGVALIGSFHGAEEPPEAMRQALFDVLLWKFELHGIDPTAMVTTASGQRVHTLAGHRDVGSTTCPGGHVHWRLSHWRDGLSREIGHVGFTDIADHPHEQAIRDLRGAGVTNGYADGTFRPEDHVTRAQMATFISRAAPLEPGDGVSFSDVTRDHPHYAGIAAVAAAGVAEGRGNGTFRPSNDVTRGQMASFLARALDLDPRDDDTFSDVGRDHPHYGTIEALAEAEIALGRGDGVFRPDNPVTRGQMASFLVRAFEIPPADADPGDVEDEHDDEGDDHQPDDEVSTSRAGA